VTSRPRCGEMVIERLSAEEVAAHDRHLVAILVDSVNGGASVGFLPPLPLAEAELYWRSVREAVHADRRVLLIARDEAGAVVGTGQLALEPRANGLHRAEVQKLMVLRAARRRGIGRALMLALEDEAWRSGRTTLVLDTREGDPSERLYRSLGWTLAGVVPQYARNGDGTLHASAFYFKLLAPAGAEVARHP
jgi:acetyltransferase